MIAAMFVFVLVSAIVGGVALAITRLPQSAARRRVELRLREVSRVDDTPDEQQLVRQEDGTLPVVERFVRQTAAGSYLERLIEQAGLTITPGKIVVLSASLGAIGGLAAFVFVRYPFAPFVAAAFAASLPFLYLLRRRGTRMRAFEEQFPDALDLVSRALRAGHAFQTAVGMAADEMAAPVGPEFKILFDQQNFGMPLRDAMNLLAERMPLVDVKFFVTAVAIQRESGGNLAEILDNLAHVVRERFKIHRQVRVHTAHGRITGFVLLALPPFLAVALSMINADHMKPLFQERVGHMLLAATIVMQIIGFFWIRKVITIEV